MIKAKIIVEGIDGTGKSTFCNLLKTTLHIHATDKTLNTFDWHFNILKQEESQVWDRSYIGEWVWSKVFNRQCKLTDEDIKKLLEVEGQVFVYCQSNIWKDVLTKRGQSNQIESRLLALKYYEDFFIKFNVPIIRRELSI